MPRRPTTRLRLTNLEDRLTPAGGLDPTFGTGGYLVSPLGEYDTVSSVLAQPDGHILVLTNSYSRGGTQVTRYNADGSLDTAFGVGGTAGGFASPGRVANVNGAVVGPDGKITLTGRTDFTRPAVPGMFVTADMVHVSTVVRLNADGTPDASFGTNGVASFDEFLRPGYLGGFSPMGSDTIYTGDLLADGSLVVTISGHFSGIKAVRLQTDGSVDPTFGVNGLFDAPMEPSGRGWVTTHTVATPDGGLLLMRPDYLHYATVPISTALMFVKLTSTGALDPAFDGDGVLTMPLGAYGGGLDVAAQPDGKLLVATSHSDGSAALAGRSVEVWRLNADGSLDASFGGDGRVEALPDGGYAAYGSLDLLPDGRVVVASGRFLAPGVGFAVLNADGTPDDYFADGSGVGGLTYGEDSNLNGPRSSFGVGGIAVAGDRVVVLSTIYGPNYWTSHQDRLGLAVLTEGSGAIPPSPVTPPQPPVVETPPLPPTGEGPGGTEVVPPPVALPPEMAQTQRIVNPPDDFNGDFVSDKVVVNGPTVSVVSGKDGSVLLKAFAPFEASYTGTLNAVFVDVNGDGKPELAVSPGQGGGPVVAVYNGDGTERGRFWGIDDTNFRGGVNLAVTQFAFGGGGVTGLIVAAGAGGGPRVAVFDASTLGAGARRLMADFFAFESDLRTGVVVTDGLGTLVFGAGAGGGPRVRGMYTNSLPRAGAAGSIDGVPVESRPFDKFVGDPATRQGVTLAVRPSTAKVVSNAYYTQEVVATAGTAPPEVVLEFTMLIAVEPRTAATTV